MNDVLPNVLPLSELIGRTKQVYSLPQTYHRLNEVVQDANSSLNEIGDVLITDQALSARILQLANSSFYGFPSRIETVSHAVTMIGAEQLMALIQGACVTSLFKGVPSELVNMETFWRHSIACGIAARSIAARRRETNTERYFLLGLLHDIGRLLIFQNLPKESALILKSAAEDARPLFQVEHDTLGYDHSDAGYELLKTWKLPPRLCEPIKMHHNTSGRSVYPIETAVLHVSDVIVHALALGTSGEHRVPTLHPAHWAQSGLDVDAIAPLGKEIRRQLDEVASVMLK